MKLAEPTWKCSLEKVKDNLHLAQIFSIRCGHFSVPRFSSLALASVFFPEVCGIGEAAANFGIWELALVMILDIINMRKDLGPLSW